MEKGDITQPYCPGTPARIRAQNCQAWGLPFTQKTFSSSLSLPRGSSQHSVYLEILRELTSLNPQSGEILDLIFQITFVSQKGEKQPYLKATQNKSYKINTNLYRSQCLDLYMVRAQMKNTTNTVNKAFGNVRKCLPLLDKNLQALCRGSPYRRSVFSPSCQSSASESPRTLVAGPHLPSF